MLEVTRTSEMALMPIKAFIKRYPVRPTMFYKNAAEGQFRHLSKTLPEALEIAPPRVLSYHTSKSIKLPVVVFEDPERGIWAAVRDNFHDVKVSARVEAPVNLDMRAPGMSLNYLNPCYFEGFPRGFVFEPYTPEARQFSFCYVGPFAPWERWPHKALVHHLGVVFGKVREVATYLENNPRCGEAGGEGET